jgi:CRISPR-associated endonuclease/helicase Cas3
MTSFAAFFEALWKSEKWPKPEPFPWQIMLAQRGASGDWPEAINLPTASGKTTCLDAAIFALAATAAPAFENRMPRRVWFVVDRRIVVDEAFDRAQKVAAKLAGATEGPAKEVGDALRAIGGAEKRPLAVARLRGGAWRDDGWARVPSQPTIVCSTVDQVGSALLFRAYGHSDCTASIYAGLAANDSLILLDEAHCAVPFLETLRAVARFRGEQWARQPLRTPFRFSIMSATPPADIPEVSTFPKPKERAAALDHPLLGQRFTARKLAALVTVKDGDDQFPTEAARRAREFAKGQGKARVAVMVNRVATAEEIALRLAGELADAAHVVLLTGRMRPLDRDTLVARWESLLKAGSTETPPKPIFVVTTQCLEVGADFSFDALVTECASLDALRQRFGRLDRLGTLRESRAAILIRERDTKEPKDEAADPIYGRAIYETWKWLNEPDQLNAGGIVNFGVEAMNGCVGALRKRDEQRFIQLLAPTSDAPVLLPAHLDLLCQTSPRPQPEPDVALFLHGKGRGAPEVRVVLRADLPDPDSYLRAREAWAEILSLVPPTSPEMLTVPLHRLRRWLAKGPPDDTDGDVQGTGNIGEERRDASARTAPAWFLLWRGRDRSELTRDLAGIRPGDVVVLRLTDDGLRGLGQAIAEPDGLGKDRLDLAERALRQARGRPMLRLHPRVIVAPLLARPAVKGLLDAATADADPDAIEAALQAVHDEDSTKPDGVDEASLPPLPGWLHETIDWLLEDKFRVEDHPTGGLVLTGKKTHIPDDAELEDDPQADEDDVTSSSREEVTLQQHTPDVCAVASAFAARCLPPELGEALTSATQGHDLGKLDRRFQIFLRNGAEDEVEAGPALAKSRWLPERRRRRAEIREDVGIPPRFRHEFLSLQLAERLGLTPVDAVASDLTLHLISSHHGYARPFAPVAPDLALAEGKVGDLSLADVGNAATLTAAERQALPPAYRLDSGVPERFWRLTRRYGWWGLAYLEAIFRLSDWEASRKPGRGAQGPSPVPHLPRSPIPPSITSIPLDALDGANPLAFLAALGTLRVLARAFPGHNLHLAWHQRLGAWRPLLSAGKSLDEEAMVRALHEAGLRLDAMFSPRLLTASEAASPKNKKGEPRWKDKLLFPIDALREFCEAATGSPSPLGEFSATWASECAATGEEGEEVARRTRFDFTAGQQAFIGRLRKLRQSCTPADLRRSLFAGWRYSPTAVSMRWDTQDEKRQYALQAVDPTDASENPPLADRGANFLAVEALPLFPLVPDRSASQPGFDRDAEGRSWRWPIWTCPVGLDAIRSLLTLSLADSEEWPASRRRALGVSVVFQCGIVQPSRRYRCFTPARSL